ncbi:MAG: metallophosphoesterase [Pseudomonadota bacterium]|nr:metallophosphoesterase [Pseudomonadota bacterium]
MRLQLYSDLHLESETFDPAPASGADVLVLAGDIDTHWRGYERFAGWPVPVFVVAGNHEFDGRDLDAALPALREHCARFGLTLLERESRILQPTHGGPTWRLLGTTRWADFDGCGAATRDRAMRAAAPMLKRSNAQRSGQLFDAAAMRSEALACGQWLAQALAEAPQGRWDHTLVVTHYAPSLRSADPRYGLQPGTASFCNADDDLLSQADMWLHGHLHCRHDYLVERPGALPTRVVCQARGLAKKRETLGHDPLAVFELD